MTKKLRIMKMTVITIIVEALGTVRKDLGKRLDEQKIRCRIRFGFMAYHKPAHWPSWYCVRQWSRRPWFNPRSSHTEDTKNGT